MSDILFEEPSDKGAVRWLIMLYIQNLPYILPLEEGVDLLVLGIEVEVRKQLLYIFHIFNCLMTRMERIGRDRTARPRQVERDITVCGERAGHGKAARMEAIGKISFFQRGELERES